MPELSDAVAIVTGGARGIGRAVSHGLAAEGTAVLVADLDACAAESTAAEIRSEGGRAIATHLDVADAASCRAAAQSALDTLGRINILVNNAGVRPELRPFTELTEADYVRVMDINAKGTFLMSKEVAPTLISQRSGCIINMSSVVGKKASPFILAYATSKWAIIGMTQCMARELAEHLVNVNAVCPGVVRTDAVEAAVRDLSQTRGEDEQTVWDWFLDRIPMGRLQEGEDIASMVVFLASERARNITGSAFNVNGGMELN